MGKPLGIWWPLRFLEFPIVIVYLIIIFTEYN